MKVIVIKLLALLISLSSCSIRKLNKDRFESSASIESEIRMQELLNDKFEGKRKILLTDTANEQYSVIIFPADTFSFSAQHGFKGKAVKIELSGKLRRVIRHIDSAVLGVQKQRCRTYEEQDRREKSASSRT